MDNQHRISEKIREKSHEILDAWSEERGGELEKAHPSHPRLLGGMESVIRVFADFLQSPDSVETFSLGGQVRTLVREISHSQHELDRDAVGVIEDFASLRRAVWRCVDRDVDLSSFGGGEVARFFTKMLQASDWVTEAALAAFEAIVEEETRKALGHAAGTDLLTGLPDRERFSRLLLPRAIESHDRASLSVFDIAGFSDIVAGGDVDRARDALRALSEAVSGTLSQEAICARFGDDEICALSPDEGGEDAYSRAERVLENLAKGDPGFEVDVGIAEYPADSADAGALVQEAFKAAKVAKRMGGGGIVTAR